MKTFYFFALSAFLMICLSSCVKEKDLASVVTVTTTAADTSFSTLKAADNFNWSTARRINFHFVASVEDDYQLVLKVTLLDGSVLFQKLQKANEDFQSVLEIPAHVTELTVLYGSLAKTFVCTSGTVNMTIN